MKEYDLAIVGGGMAGISAAYAGKEFSKNIVLIEKDKQNLKYAFSKILSDISKQIYSIKQIDSSIEVKPEEVLKRVRQLVSNGSNSNYIENLKKCGVNFINGEAKFIDRNTIEVNRENIKAKKSIIATGAVPLIPDIKGIDTVNYFTYDSIFDAEKLPSNMVVVGAGASGVGLSQALNRIGVKVTLVDAYRSILYGEEPEIIEIISNRLTEEGVDIHTHSKVLEVFEKENRIVLKMKVRNKEEELTSDGLLLCTGKKSNIDGLNLFDACVHYDKNGINVNEYFQTSAEIIYAAGDVIGHKEFLHLGNVDGKIAAENALRIFKHKIKYSSMPYCIYSDPEIGRTGLSEQQVNQFSKGKVKIYTGNYGDLDIAKIYNHNPGLIKIICDRNDKIVGASVCGNNAEEIINQIQIMKTFDIKPNSSSKVVFGNLTYGEILSKISEPVFKNIKNINRRK